MATLSWVALNTNCPQSRQFCVCLLLSWGGPPWTQIVFLNTLTRIVTRIQAWQTHCPAVSAIETFGWLDSFHLVHTSTVTRGLPLSLSCHHISECPHSDSVSFKGRVNPLLCLNGSYQSFSYPFTKNLPSNLNILAHELYIFPQLYQPKYQWPVKVYPKVLLARLRDSAFNFVLWCTGYYNPLKDQNMMEK